MQSATPSRTAQWVAMARSLGMLLPESERIAEDPYGALFSSPWLAQKLASGLPHALAHLPGIPTWIAHMQVRTRLLDDAVRAFVQSGGRQLVVLGAGYDCRALRMPELANARVFEVDHPATQSRKRAVLAQNGISSPARFLAWNFETQLLAALPKALAELGHDARAPTLTLWEGVTMYLSDSAVNETLHVVAGLSAPGSHLAMTYLPKGQTAPLSLPTRLVRSLAARLGEPFRWGCDPEALPAYLREHGFELKEDVALARAARKLLPPRLARTLTWDDSHVAIAERI